MKFTKLTNLTFFLVFISILSIGIVSANGCDVNDECDGVGIECEPEPENDYCYYNGTCDLNPAECSCDYESQYCPESGTEDNGICYYGERTCSMGEVVDMHVAGFNCGCGQSTDSETVNVDVAGTYSVWGLVHRGYPEQCQTNETFYLNVNGGPGGPVNPDDVAPCAISERIEYLGTFSFSAGQNTVNMISATQCLPQSSCNSVTLTKLYVSTGCGLSTAPMGCYDECDSDLGPIDTEGPVTSDLNATKVFGACGINIEALETDLCSNVDGAEYFIGSCGLKGTGYSLNALDGDFDEFVEAVFLYNIFSGVSDGRVDVYVRGKDSQENWGECEQTSIDLDCDVPLYPTCEEGDGFTGIAINNECNPDELLVCGINPTLTANICDVESTIQLAEYFIDEDCENQGECLNWKGINMSAVDGEYYDEHCEDVEAEINLSLLEEGTHYVQLHGKDSQENWGKFDESAPLVSFIKDTTPPKVEKNITFNGSHVQCYGNELAESGVFIFESNMSLIDPCYYVKQGTAITLTAYDFNPDNDSNGGYNNLSGEYANNVVIRYIVRWKNESGDGWTVLVNRTGEVNKSVIINLSEDSYHLIEYWAVDLCGEESEHRWELDIVDTQAPETTKQIIGPQYYNESEDKLYIDGVTRINLTCVDPEPHPVNDVSIYYRYRVDEGQGYGDWTDFFSYGGVFGFPEESKHELEYYCIDALGNEEEHKFEIDYVDKTPPTTTKIYGEPFYTDGLRKWINSSTPVTLIADDGDKIHDSGVNVTYWRNTLVDDMFCYEPESCEFGQGIGEWNIYVEPFFKPEQSCHLIEYYSVDNVNKTEEIEKQCVFVDNTPPHTQISRRSASFNES